ncbi:hypothetical protein TNCV_2222331 [Trichonephila clavipes]|nr:hypothetical protein TNCV_2222331 [Trichonephila clavipes]
MTIPSGVMESIRAPCKVLGPKQDLKRILTQRQLGFGPHRTLASPQCGGFGGVHYDTDPKCDILCLMYSVDAVALWLWVRTRKRIVMARVLVPLKTRHAEGLMLVKSIEAQCPPTRVVGRRESTN